MNKKLLEIQEILYSNNKFNIDNKILQLKNKYKDELDGFKYIYNKNIFKSFKNKYIRYISFDDKINYGGFFYKIENINGKLFIYLINKNKVPWKIDFDRNYIFYNEYIRSINESKRNIFDIFIKNYN